MTGRKISRRKFDEALDAAAYLATEYNVLLFTLARALSRGLWQTRGGMGETTPGDGNGTGYLPPLRGFQDRLVPGDLSALDRMRANPHLALCGLMGVTLDVLDIDVQDGGDVTHARLAAEGRYPTRIVGRVRTPSGGIHDFTPTMNIGSPPPSPLHRGIDLKGGRDGIGKGWVFLAPTLKLSKITGELERYGWETLPKPRKDHKRPGKGARLFVEDRGVVSAHARSAGATPDPATDALLWAEQPRPERQRLDRALAGALASELGRLTALCDAALPDDEYRANPARYTGQTWRNTVFGVACNMVELAQSGWTSYTREEARADWLAACPRDEKFTQAALERLWTAAEIRVGTKVKPYPAVRPAPVEPDLTFDYVPREQRA